MLLLVHGYCLYSESTYRLCASRRFYADFKTKKLDPSHPSGWPCITFGRSSVSNIHSDNVVISSGLPLVSRRFELFKVASVQTSQQHVRTLFSVRQVREFSSQTQIWENNCKCPDDRSTPSGRYPWWGKTWRRFATVRTTCIHSLDAKHYYGNCVQQKCNCPDTALFRKEFQHFWNAGCTVVRPDAA